ncbi:hypothetical protein CCMA1212_008506 [Trichoderma ghanense]|uniref:SSCRP protein n=1 Tax=Trichoderma ghanense TaxID=65468 RepID=A0ABY2GUU3_9HYPO
MEANLPPVGYKCPRPLTWIWGPLSLCTPGNVTISLINSASATKPWARPCLQESQKPLNGNTWQRDPSFCKRASSPSKLIPYAESQPPVLPLRIRPANGRAHGKLNSLGNVCVCAGISDEAHISNKKAGDPMIPVAASHAGCGVQAIKSAIIRERCNPEPAGDHDCLRGHMAAGLPILPGTCLAV